METEDLIWRRIYAAIILFKLLTPEKIQAWVVKCQARGMGEQEMLHTLQNAVAMDAYGFADGMLRNENQSEQEKKDLEEMKKSMRERSEQEDKDDTTNS